MARFGVWCTPPKDGGDGNAGWLQEAHNRRMRRVTFTTKAEAEQEAGGKGPVKLSATEWCYEARQILERPKPKKKKGKKR